MLRTTHLLAISGLALLFLGLISLSSCEEKPQYPGGNTIGPAYGGRITGIVPHPEDPQQLIVCSPGGGVQRTADNGRTWKDLAQGLTDHFVYQIELDITDDNILYAATPSTLFSMQNPFGPNPVWKAVAGGEAEGPVPDSPELYVHSDGNAFTQMRLKTNNDRIIFWARQGGALYYSFEGENFARHNFLPESPRLKDRFISVIGYDAQQRVLIKTMNAHDEEPIIYRSVQAWNIFQPHFAWEKNSGTLPSGLKIVDMTLHAAPDEAVMLTQNKDHRIQLWKNNSASNTWEPTGAMLPIANTPVTVVHRIAGDSYMVGALLPYYSPDRGRNWQVARLPEDHVDARAIAQRDYPETGRYLWVGTDGFSRSSLSPPKGNITRWEINAIDSPTNPVNILTLGLNFWQAYNVLPIDRGSNTARFITGSQDNGTMCIDLEQVTGWKNVDGGGITTCGDVYAIVSAPSDPNRVYLRNCSAGVWATDNAQSASTCEEIRWAKYPTNDDLSKMGAPQLWTNGSISVHPENKDLLAVTLRLQIAVSSDGAANWQFFSLPGDAIPSAVLMTRDKIYTGTKGNGLYVSADGGQNWQIAGLQTEAPTHIRNIVEKPDEPGSVYAATTSGLFLIDDTRNVQLLTEGGLTVSDIAVHPSCPNVLYASFGMQQYIHQPGAILKSVDGGSTWTPLYEKGSPVSDLHISTMGQDILLGVATYGRGIQNITITNDCISP